MLVAEQTQREANLRDMVEGRPLGDTQVRLGLFLADAFEEQAPVDDPIWQAARVIELIRAFNKAEREAKETGQPVAKPKVVGVESVLERLGELLPDDVDHPGSQDDYYAAGVSDSIDVVKKLGGVE